MSCVVCSVEATYNYKNQKPQYCTTHKKDGMIDTKHKKCAADDCSTRPSFNFSDQQIGIFCRLHKKDGMIDVNTKHCCYVDCNLVPAYNYEGTFKGIYCNKHKKDGMVNVKTKKCQNLNCSKVPCFNYKGEKSGIYCYEHKKENMIDVKNKRCQNSECNKIASYNYKEQKNALFCSSHKEDDMVDVKSKKCEEINCFIQPFYNFEGIKRAKFCKNHKKDGMIDVRSKRCKSEWCDTYVKNKYQGYCYHCFTHLFPNHKLSRNYKTKENEVIEYIKSKFKNIRTMEISKDINHRPMVIIRFNPDDYINDEGIKIQSCWRSTKNGVVLVKNRNEDWNIRIKKLRKRLKFWLKNIPQKTIIQEKLFYDTKDKNEKNN